jgi:hypothetical protein
MARIVEEADERDQELLESYEEAAAEHDALRKYLAYLSRPSGAEGR